MTATRRIAAFLCVGLLAAAQVAAQPFPVLQGDPVDGLGRALPILPGVPLITANQDGDFNPPVVDPGTIGDVDLVVRAGHLSVGAAMPPPVLIPPMFAAGGSRFPGGVDIPFTVIASDGDPLVPGGLPLLGPELDGIPVVVFAFADLDRDGFVGPTNDDTAAAADNGREAQESEFPVGIRVAYFSGGVAQGVIASDVGAPASDGGLPVVLTAAAYVGQFSPDFFLGTVPDGPAVATLLPSFPRLDPDRLLETDGSAGPALPDGRLAIEFESEFEPPVGDPVLGTPFALPTNGSSVTIDRALVGGGSASSARIVGPSSPFGLTGNEARLPLRPGAGGTLYEPLETVELPTDGGLGNGADVRIVAVDRLGTVTDPAAPLSVDVVLEDDVGIVIASPDADGDPTRESLALTDASGALITLDDVRVASGQFVYLALEIDGARVGRARVDFVGDPSNSPPLVGPPALVGQPDVLQLDCPRARTLAAEITDNESDLVGATAVFSQGATEVGPAEMSPSATPNLWTVPVPNPPSRGDGVLRVIITARDSRGNQSEPRTLDTAIVDTFAPSILDVSVSPSPLTANARVQTTVAATFPDTCGIQRVTARLVRDDQTKRFARLNDRGRRGDVAAGDAVFTGRRRLRAPDTEAVTIEVTATNPTGESSVRRVTVPVVP
jgi:hypothetical protein